MPMPPCQGDDNGSQYFPTDQLKMDFQTHSFLKPSEETANNVDPVETAPAGVI